MGGEEEFFFVVSSEECDVELGFEGDEEVDDSFCVRTAVYVVSDEDDVVVWLGVDGFPEEFEWV